MEIKNVFSVETCDDLTRRINVLTPTSRPQWGKMHVAQMLGHCNTIYAMIYDKDFPRPNWFMRKVLRLVVKPIAVGPKPFKRNLPTSPNFIQSNECEFLQERDSLLNNLQRVVDSGASYFDGRISPNFGKLTIDEWNTLMYKHLDHHLQQFGV